MTLECPRCGATHRREQVSCGTCGKVFKAYGHPGVNLFTAPVGEILCTSCRYHSDDSCDLPNYPQATECTLYRDERQPRPSPLSYRPQRRWGWLIGGGTLLLLSLYTALHH